ncbi:hypothetical protein GSI_05158 [Ganoderma sinense ZZ0214-1]|uniref:Uncharacterized protein n=1 Tax=Ganoderma sinense ZZ0214-1 TaxID=1077348 RepID=A0A2G8SFA6_9APHY|nr:hypothetical protein GSI_05158 [Ganoderma sinense ZZ0214-1]
MAANTTSTLAPSAFTLAGPVTTTTVPSHSQSLSRRVELNARIHQAHVRARIRRIQSLGRGLPSSTRAPQRRTRAVAHTIATTPAAVAPLAHLPVAIPAPRRPLAALILNGLPTPPATAAPPPTPVPVPQRPLLPTRRSRDGAARTRFHGTGAGLSFGLDVFGDDDPLFTPRVPVPELEDENVRRTPGAPANQNGSGDYFPAPLPPLADLEDGEIEVGEERVGREGRAV